MNIQQIQYALNLAETRHFERAADRSIISQSTLSTMISKLEDELGILIFDRKQKPVGITAEGEVLLEQFRKVQKELQQLNELVAELKGELKGRLSLSVIPTVAPYVLPTFLHHFAARFPDLEIEVREETTANILRRIKARELDMGLLSLPVNEPELVEHHLYDEPFAYYDANWSGREAVTAAELDISNICLLEEGHCMRNQVLELCNFDDVRLKQVLNFRYKAGSIDSLMRFVKVNKASTLLPWLSVVDLPEADRRHLSHFTAPVPYRSIGLVVHRHFVKNRILYMLREEIRRNVLPFLPEMGQLGRQLMPV
jgi:LysR family transcriptional regulator, hydrogen peroxide-inducible genes activator